MCRLWYLIILIIASNYLFASEQTSYDKLELSSAVVFSHVVTKDTAKGRGAEFLKEEVKKNKEKLSGYNELQVYPSSLLFDDTKVMAALASNKVQLAAPSISKLLKYNPHLKIFDFPFLFRNIKEVEVFYETAKGKLFLAEGNGMFYLEPDEKKEKTYLVLGLWHGGMKQLSSNQAVNISSPISSPKLLDGQTFRVQDSPIIKFTFERLGAKLKIEDDFAKVKKLLRKGTVDGQENTWSNIESEKFYEHQQYVVETNHGYLGYLLLTNKTFWDELEKKESLKEDKQHQLNQLTWLTMLGNVTSTVSQESDKLNGFAKNKVKGDEVATDLKKETKKEIVDKITLQVDKPQFPSFDDKADRDRWCNIIYNVQTFDKWKEFIEGSVEKHDGIGKEIVLIAIAEKPGCPFDFFRKMFGIPSPP